MLKTNPRPAEFTQGNHPVFVFVDNQNYEVYIATQPVSNKRWNLVLETKEEMDLSTPRLNPFDLLKESLSE